MSGEEGPCEIIRGKKFFETIFPTPWHFPSTNACSKIPIVPVEAPSLTIQQIFCKIFRTHLKNVFGKTFPEWIPKEPLSDWGDDRKFENCILFNFERANVLRIVSFILRTRLKSCGHNFPDLCEKNTVGGTRMCPELFQKSIQRIFNHSTKVFLDNCLEVRSV